MCVSDPCTTIMLVYNTPTPWCISTVQSHLTCLTPHTHTDTEPDVPPLPPSAVSRS